MLKTLNFYQTTPTPMATFTMRENGDMDLDCNVNGVKTEQVMYKWEVRQLRNFLNQMHPIQLKKRSRPTPSTRASTKRRKAAR